MTPDVAILIVQALLKYGPGLAQQVSAIFQKQSPTFSDFDALFESVRTYESYLEAPKPA